MSIFTRRMAAGLASTLLAVTALAACGGNSDKASSDGLKELVLQKYPGAALYTSEIIADEEGIFKKHGLKVTFVNPGDGATSMKLLANGRDTQGVVGDISAGLAARSKGQGIVAVGSVINKSVFQITGSNEMMKVQGDWKAKMQALKGKTVAVPGIGGSAGVTMVGLLKAAGLNPDKDVTLVSITTVPAALAQFEQGKIDAFIYIAPGAAVVEAAGEGGLYLDIANDAPDEFANAVNAMLASEKFAKENPDIIKAWIAAEEEAINWMKDPANREATVGYFAKNTTNGDQNLAKSLADFFIDTAYTATNKGLTVPMDVLDVVVKSLVDGGLVEKGSVTAEDMVFQAK